MLGEELGEMLGWGDDCADAAVTAAPKATKYEAITNCCFTTDELQVSYVVRCAADRGLRTSYPKFVSLRGTSEPYVCR
jgi:hypothetical protein